MRTVVLPAILIAVSALSSPLAARDRGEGLVIDVSPRSWLDAGKVPPVGQRRDYVTNTGAFGGSPTNGISSRADSNMPFRGISGPGFAFEFLGANVLR